MKKKLNWKKDLLHKNKHFSIVPLLFMAVLLFVQATSNLDQDPTVKFKTKYSEDSNNVMKAYLAMNRVGGSFPCGDVMGIALEDTGRYIFSAQSGWLATLLPGTSTHVVPPDGPGWQKTNNEEEISKTTAYNNTKNLSIGYFEGAHGLRWAITDEQATELYDQVHTVNLGGEEFTAFDHNNMFYEGLISTQILIKTTEEQASIIESQRQTIELLTQRLENIENALNIDSETIPHKTLGEVSISPNPITNGTIQVNYQLNDNVTKAALIISDIQGKQVYEMRVNANQKRGMQYLNIDLPAGTYMYYLENDKQQTNAKKLIIL